MEWIFIQIYYEDGLDGNNILILKENDVKVITDLMMGGDGTNIENYTPVQVQNISNCKKIEINENHTVFLLNDSTCKAVGQNNFGQLGDGTTINRNIPVQISDIINCTDIGAANSYSSFLFGDGSCKAVGKESGVALIDSII